ncbi:C-type lectin domain family 4 member E-like isoform X2 [Esox lucius]|nr:C-type lectin domain family 4 member E-like isoform X2 [Esox lucius]
MVTLACLWILLFCLATAWVVLFVSSRTTDNLSATGCAIGWEFYNGSCYHFSDDKLTWEQSQYACIHDGGHLVIIESWQEQDFIRKKVGNNFVENTYWIGMTDIEVEGVWVWMDNTTLNDNIMFWDPRNGTENSDKPEPNNWLLMEHCARMGRRCLDQMQCWFDYICNIPCKRICESRAAKT